MNTKMLLASEWLDQSKLNDPMKGRVVILAWIDKDNKTSQISTNEEWFEGSIEDAEKVSKPNYAYGHYFTGANEITNETLADFYDRCSNLFSIFRE